MVDTITYTRGVDGSAQTFTIAEEMLGILESFRLSRHNPDGTPQFATIPDMLRADLNRATITPAVQAFPTAAIAEAAAKIPAAYAEYESTVQAVIEGAITG